MVIMREKPVNLDKQETGVYVFHLQYYCNVFVWLTK